MKNKSTRQQTFLFETISYIEYSKNTIIAFHMWIPSVRAPDSALTGEIEGAVRNVVEANVVRAVGLYDVHATAVVHGSPLV